MASKFFKLVFLLAAAMPLLAQEADSLTYAEGVILSAETQQPVTARIVYKSLPYGNRIGIINGSKYEFAMFDNDKYSIEVIAEIGRASCRERVEMWVGAASGERKRRSNST